MWSATSFSTSPSRAVTAFCNSAVGSFRELLPHVVTELDRVRIQCSSLRASERSGPVNPCKVGHLKPTEVRNAAGCSSP